MCPKHAESPIETGSYALFLEISRDPTDICDHNIDRVAECIIAPNNVHAV